MHLSEGGFQVVWPLGLWSPISGSPESSPDFDKSDVDMASKLFTLTYIFTSCLYIPLHSQHDMHVVLSGLISPCTE